MTSAITYEMLEAAGACASSLEWFAGHLLDGGTWDDVVEACLDNWHPDYAAWLGWHCPAEVEGATWAARLALQRDDRDRAALGRRCPAGVEGATWAARLALQRDDRDRAALGWYCPAGVEGATWEARLALQQGDGDRAELGRLCPAGVEGATWAARLALQRTWAALLCQ